MRKIFAWASDPDDGTDGARCSGCGRFVPCRHCPSDTPVLTPEQWAVQEAAWERYGPLLDALNRSGVPDLPDHGHIPPARTSHQLCLFCGHYPDLCDCEGSAPIIRA